MKTNKGNPKKTEEISKEKNARKVRKPARTGIEPFQNCSNELAD